MTWSRFDDGYDEHEKIQDAWDAEPATIGLHVMATTACNRWLSDGVIRPRWIQRTLPDKRHRERVLAVMVEVGLLDLLPAGETRHVTDLADNLVEIGPFDEARYVVHDFLDRHDSSVMVKEKRRRDAERKARGRSGGRLADSVESPRDVRADSTRTPRGRNEDSVRNPGAVQTESIASRARGRGAPTPASRPDPTRPFYPPIPPKGGRRREVDAFEEQMQSFAGEHFPGAHPSKVRALAAHLRDIGVEPSVDAMRSYAAERPEWALSASEEAGVA
jgi:hypothetical protein